MARDQPQRGMIRLEEAEDEVDDRGAPMDPAHYDTPTPADLSKTQPIPEEIVRRAATPREEADENRAT
jgi:hypothetical protein